MSTVIISATTGQTAQVEYAPPAGKKWTVLSAYAVLNTGSGSGTRELQVWIERSTGGSTWYQDEVLVRTGAQTGTLTAYQTAMTPTGAAKLVTVTVTAQYLPTLNHADRIAIGGTLISGDSFEFAIEVDEVIDE